LADLLSTPPDLLIADDKMPAITGEQLCRVLSKENVRYPILVDSPVEETQAWVKEFAGRGLNVSLFSSPRDPESVVRAIENALNIRRDD
jgi:DNA-binding NarL/FixJ family response regulator